jgi:hypothetical protein
MRRTVGIFALVSVFVALVPLAGSAYAKSREQCKARCDHSYNPLNAAKVDRWRVDEARRVCKEKCR